MRPAVNAVGDLAAAAREIARLRVGLERIVALAEDAPELTDAQLRARLVTLAEQLPGGDQS